MNYIAIDFETANEKRNSPCSIGIVVVKNGHVVEKIHHMIRPKEMKFMPINIGIHGIRPAMVENEPEFDKVWEKIRHHFNGNLVIAHNASFDISDELKCKDINEISDLLGVTVGTVTGSGYRPSSVKGGVLRISGRIKNTGKENKFERLEYDAFKNQVVVFTGKLNSMSRDEAMRLVRRLGGTTGSTVTRKTTILVTNMKDIKDLCREEMSTKLKKAADLKAKGQNIKLLNEEEFLNR